MANWKALTLISITIGLCGLTLIIVLFTATGGYVPFDYGVVLDAGSSHTQITLYHWKANKNRCTGVVEQLDTCRIEGGISSYNVSDVSSIGEDLLGCVRNVSQKIDKDRTALTPIYLGATAGMRLLNITDPISVELIFTLIGNAFKLKTSLQTQTVDIISGQEEGLFSWVTNNYLMNKLVVDQFDERSPQSTIGMLDMGGASAQIAYRTGQKNSSVLPNEVNVRLYGVNHTVRSSSNLCFGADQALQRYLKILILASDPERDVIDNPCLPIGSTVTVSADQFKDQVCLKGKKDIKYDRNYTFNGISDANECMKRVGNHLLNRSECLENFDMCFDVLDSQPPESTLFYALSNYYYTVRVLNLTEPTTVDDYMKKMYDFCSSDRESILKNPLVIPKYVDKYCFQLNFVYNTIKNIYKFDDKMWENIKFANSINKTQLGWSLGFMINATNAIAAEKPTPPVVEVFPFILVTTFCTIILLFSIYFGIRWKRKPETEPTEHYQPYQPISITA